MTNNANKSSFLGLPWGTANNQLRKRILFSLVQQLQQDVCFRCKQPIETIEQLSIEHKKPWENVSVDLFWDLDNIAFSHHQCKKSTADRIKIMRNSNKNYGR